MTKDAPLNPTERRKHARYDVALAAQLYFNLDVRRDIAVVDLSFEGLCIEAGRSAFDEVLPTISSADDYDRVPLRVSFNLEREGVNTEVRVLCSSAYLKDIGAQRCQMGLEVVDVELGVLELSDYIMHLG